MRNITVLLLTIIGVASAQAQSPQFAWVKNIGGVQNDAAGPIVCDASGNLYSTGYFRDLTLSIGGQTLTNSSSNSDAYFAKWDTDGNLIWVKNFGGDADQSIGSFGGAITLDNEQNIYVAVSTLGTSVNIEGTDHPINFGNAPYVDYAIVKYSADGTHQWTKLISGSGNDSIEDIDVDHNGNLVFTASSTSANLTIAGVVSANPSGKSIVKLSSADGSLLSTTPTSLFNKFIFDDQGNMYLVGNFTENITIGTTSLTLMDVAPYTGEGDIALYKIAADGSVVWVRHYGGNREDRSQTIGFDIVGNIVIAGTFLSQSINFGGIIMIKIQSKSDFLIKVDPDGNTVYAKHVNIGQYGTMNISGLQATADGSMYITGFNSGTMNLNGLSYTITPNSQQHSYNQFIAKLDSEGNGIWMKDVGGMLYGTKRHFTMDHQGKIFIAGFYSAQSTFFDTITLINPGTNTQNSYLAKLDPDFLETHDFAAQKTVVFPSPAESVLYFSNIDLQPYRILDVLGRIVTSGENSDSVDVSGLKSGTYYLEIGNDVLRFLKK